MSTNRHTSVSSIACTLGLAMLLTLAGSDLSAETFRSGDSAASIEQRGGIYRSQSHIIRFEDGHCIVKRDGRNTDVTIQRNSTPQSGTDERFCEDHERVDRRNMEERFSWRGRTGHDAKSLPDSSRVQELFLRRMIERLGWHFLRYR